jgi:hypothetical protein
LTALFCCATQFPILISAASGAACLPGKVHKHRTCSHRTVDRRREPSATPIISWTRMPMKALPLRDGATTDFRTRNATAVRCKISTCGG